MSDAVWNVARAQSEIVKVDALADVGVSLRNPSQVWRCLQEDSVLTAGPALARVAEITFDKLQLRIKFDPSGLNASGIGGGVGVPAGGRRDRPRRVVPAPRRGLCFRARANAQR